MERNIQRDTCGLGHWRQPEEWDKEPFSHTVTMVTDWTGHMGGWQIYNSGVTVALINRGSFRSLRPLRLVQAGSQRQWRGRYLSHGTVVRAVH